MVLKLPILLQIVTKLTSMKEWLLVLISKMEVSLLPDITSALPWLFHQIFKLIYISMEGPSKFPTMHWQIVMESISMKWWSHGHGIPHGHCIPPLYTNWHSILFLLSQRRLFTHYWCDHFLVWPCFYFLCHWIDFRLC